MSRVTIIRYTTKPDRAEENEALSRAVFAELRALAPEHVAYAVFREGTSFLHLFVNTRADDASVLTALPSFKTFSANGSERWEGPPEQTRLSLQLVESYRLT